MQTERLQPRCIALAPNVGVHHLWTDDLKDKRKEAAVWLVRSDERACIGILVWLFSLCDSNCCFTPRPVLDYIRKSFVGHFYPCSSSFRKCAVTKSPKQLPVCESLSLSVRISWQWHTLYQFCAVDYDKCTSSVVIMCWGIFHHNRHVSIIEIKICLFYSVIIALLRL